MNKVLPKLPEDAIATARTFRMSAAAGATGAAFISQVPPAPSVVKEKKIEDAVFGYIRAVRALGRTTINTHEVARALDLWS
jgi:hypothetical protein